MDALREVLDRAALIDYGRVMELVDIGDLKSPTSGCEGSNPSPVTNGKEQGRLMDGERLAVCENCGARYDPAELTLSAEDLNELAAPGAIIPEGECPACGHFCYMEED